MTRTFPKPWYVNVRVHLADHGVHRNGWYQHCWRYRSQRAARIEYERAVALSVDELGAAVDVAIHGRRLEPKRGYVSAIVTWGSRKVRGEEEVTR